MGTPFFIRFPRGGAKLGKRGKEVIKVLADLYIPEKVNCLPEKKIFLARAGARYSNLVKEKGFMDKANALYLEAFRCIEPMIFYTTTDVEGLPDTLLPNVFHGVTKVTLFLSTMGDSMDELISSYLNKGKTFEAFLLDAWASESLETLNDHFDEQLRQHFGNGTMRFSPGYGDVDIRMNKYVVKELLKVDKITVLDSGEMVPSKTTTCMIGWDR
jgi:hypothetical protein